MTDRYKQLGASATKAGLHDVLKSEGLHQADTPFIQLFPSGIPGEDEQSFLHCDGAGTKTIVPYLMYRECGDLSAFAGLAQDALVMNLDDVFCIGPVHRLALANFVGRNAKLIGDDVLSVLLKRYSDLRSMLERQGILLHLAGGETADCGDIVRTLSVDAVLSGSIRTKDIVNAHAISPGDVIVGLASSGRASYETFENSGIGSNGLTLARHALLKRSLAEKYPEIVDPALSASDAYHGPFSVSDEPTELGMSVGQALASPTRTFAPVLKRLYEECKNKIHGVIHVTGGGLTKVIRFGKGNLYVKNNLFAAPAVFRLIQEHGKVGWKEMYQVFNMGQRLEVYLPEKESARVIELARSFGIEGKLIGHVEKLPGSQASNNKVVVESSQGTFEYEL